jgi:hypothetical protein
VPGSRGGCGVVDRAGNYSQEAFDPVAFDESLAAGGQVLCVGHDDSRKLRGSFRRLGNDAGQLLYRFKVFDGPLEQRIFDCVQRGLIRHCSIAFVPRASRWRDGATIESAEALQGVRQSRNHRTDPHGRGSGISGPLPIACIGTAHRRAMPCSWTRVFQDGV